MLDPQCPNPFDFATKKLSQDAMIRRLIRWADHRHTTVNPELRECGRNFVGALPRQHPDTTHPERLDTQILQQGRDIDLPARVGPDHVLLIDA